MKFTVEPTKQSVIVDGSRCRIFRGEAEDGTPVDILVRGVLATEGDAQKFTAELADVTAEEIRKNSFTIDEALRGLHQQG